MNIKNRIKKISDRMREQAAETENAPFLTLEQWERHADGEDITAEIPAHRLAEFNEWERVADGRVKEIERIYLSHDPDLQEAI